MPESRAGGPLATVRGPARAALAVLMGGLLAAAAWLIVMQEAHKKGYTEHEVNAALGGLLTSSDAEVARRGFYGTVACAVVLALVYRLTRGLAPRHGRWGHWTVRAMGVALVVLLAWGLVLGPLAGSSGVPSGVFGLDADLAAPLCAVLSAVATGLTLVRVVDLVDSDDWWERKHFDLRESMESLFTQGVDGTSGVVPGATVSPPGAPPEEHPPFRH